jgi:CRP/FNR family cyclic AMP-dependent transcriptional regulator
MGTDKEEYLSKIKDVLVFKFLTVDELKKLLKVSDIIPYDKNLRIVTEGDVAPFFFALLEGQVNITVTKQDGKEAYICTLGTGDIFGEAGIFVKVKRTANVWSVENTTILKISRTDMFKFIKNNQTAGIKILMLVIYSMLKKLRLTNQELAFERAPDMNQNEIDDLIKELTGSG